MKMKRHTVGLGILLVVLVFCAKNFYKTESNHMIHLSVNNIIQSFDPAVAFNDDALFVMAQVHQTLYQYHYLKRPYEVIPSLADGMPEISKDNLVYKIKIKKGIRYHTKMPPERTLIVDDFIWQIKRLAFKPLKSTGTWLFTGKIKGFDEFSERVGDSFQNFLNDNIEGLKKLDDHTFEIHLTKPDPNLLYFLSMQFTSPVPLELITQHKNDLRKTLIGTGPYEFTGFAEGVYKLKKFAHYYDEFYPTTGDRYANTEKLLQSSKEKLPFIKNIRIQVVEQEEERWKKFKNGELDILDVPKNKLSVIANPKSDISRTLKEQGVATKHFPRQTTRWIGFNMNDEVLGKNRHLRKAISYALDYDKYIEIITNNTNLKSNSIFNPSIAGYDPGHRVPYEFNLDKARQYLKKAGVKPGELELTYSTRGKQEIHFKEADFIKEQLSQIGINVKINAIEFSEFLKKGRAGQLQFWTDNWIYDYPDAENLLQLLITKNHPGINKSGYSNTKVDELYNELSRTLDQKKRAKLMYEIEKDVEKDLPWIMLMYESAYILHQGNIKNFRKSYFIRNYLKYLQKN